MSVRFCGARTSRTRSLSRHAPPRATRNAQGLTVQKESLRRRGSGSKRFRDDKTLTLGRSNGNGNAMFSSSEDSFDDEVFEQSPRSNRRVLLKISGEALQGQNGSGIDPEVLRCVSQEIKLSKDEGHQIAIVVGGGNFFRGADAFEGIDRVTADHVGMLATTMNAICLQSMLENFGVPTRVQTAIEIRQVAEPFIRRRAIRHLEKGRVVIFGAGIGNPFFTTDMAAVLRAAEIDAHEVLKATKVDGIFSSDPDQSATAAFLPHVTYDQALRDGLHFMDSTAISMCRDQDIPVRVFNLFREGNILKAIRGDSVGTTMRRGEETDTKVFVASPASQLTGPNGLVTAPFM